MADIRQVRISGGHLSAKAPAATVSTAFRQCYNGAPGPVHTARLYESPVTGGPANTPGTTTQTMASRGAPR
jgi:hypothetical protein